MLQGIRSQSIPVEQNSPPNVTGEGKEFIKGLRPGILSSCPALGPQRLFLVYK